MTDPILGMLIMALIPRVLAPYTFASLIVAYDVKLKYVYRFTYSYKIKTWKSVSIQDNINWYLCPENETFSVL